MLVGSAFRPLGVIVFKYEAVDVAPDQRIHHASPAKPSRSVEFLRVIRLIGRH